MDQQTLEALAAQRKELPAWFVNIFRTEWMRRRQLWRRENDPAYRKYMRDYHIKRKAMCRARARLEAGNPLEIDGEIVIDLNTPHDRHLREAELE